VEKGKESGGACRGDRVMILIPAKGHSERVPGKNLRTVGGRTLVDWAVERAVDSGLGHVVVSTDSKDIERHVLLAVGGSGIRKPIICRRSAALGKGRVTKVCAHAIEQFRKAFDRIDTLILTLPTSPFITYQDLQRAYRQFVEGGRRTLFGMVKTEKSKSFLFTRSEGSREIVPYYQYDVNRVAPLLYTIVGGLVIMDVPYFLSAGDYYEMPPWQGYELEPERAVDIDTEQDFHWAEFLLREVLQRGDEEAAEE